MKKFLLESRLTVTIVKRQLSQGLLGAIIWSMKGAGVPAPNYVKWKTIEAKFSENTICIETGTYLGETTKWLAKKYPRVISLEPQEMLFNFARNRFKRKKNIEIQEGSSEDLFGQILDKIEKDSNLNFWLDGHFSDGMTYKGKWNTPLVEELRQIELRLDRFDQLVVAIDDFRDFRQSSQQDHPSRGWLVEWANKNGFFWDVKNDIFLWKEEGIPK